MLPGLHYEAEAEFVPSRSGIERRPCFLYSPKPLACYRLDPAEHFLCIRAIEVEQVFGAVKELL
ncbi:MAG TPA: hypothetical protein VFH95_13185 [Candidatus Kapabacteria bacterium]|nr:hypothetical protein [Candidatus Kapabacteria bacterium]